MNKSVHHIVVGTCFVVLSLASAGHAYVLSSDQMLRPFLKMLSGVHTVRIDMATTIYDEPTAPREVREQLLVKKGGRFRAERIFPSGLNILMQDGRKARVGGFQAQDPDGRRIDTVFPTLFSQRSREDLLNTLNYLGVDTQTVGIDRMNGTVAFVVGEPLEQKPGSRLWVEQKRRLPLRFVGVGISGGETVTLMAEYTEYRQVDTGLWFPGRIEYHRNGSLRAVSVLRTISLNETLDESLFNGHPGTVGWLPVSDFLNIKE